MWSKPVDKTILILGLLALVLAVGVLIRTDVGRSYLGWLGATVSKMNPLNSNPENDESGLDLSNVNLDNSDNQPSQDKGNENTAENQPSAPLTLDEMSVKVSEISKTVSNIEKEIKNVKELNRIQTEVNRISAETNEIAGKIDDLNRLSKIQQEIDSIVKKADLLSQEIAKLA